MSWSLDVEDRDVRTGPRAPIPSNESTGAGACGPLKVRFRTVTTLLLALLFSTSFFSLCFPYGFPVFPVLAGLSFLWASSHRQTVLPRHLGVVLLALCVLAYMSGVLQGGIGYREVRRDMQNVAGVFLVLPVLQGLTRREEFARFRAWTCTLSAVLLTAVAILSLYKFHLLLQGRTIAFFKVPDRPYPWGTSLVSDYNFFAFAMGIGAVSAVYALVEARTPYRRTGYTASLLLTLASGVLAGSRRFWICLAIALIAAPLIAVIWASRKMLASVADRRWLLRIGFLLGVLVVAVISLIPERTATLAFSQASVDLLYRFTTMMEFDKSFAPRASRWEFSLHLAENRSLGEQLVGSGFDYLPTFSRHFMPRGDEDYPHNPILSALLYSGIGGAFLVLLLWLVSFVGFVRAMRVDTYFLMVYLAANVFLVVSAHSLFSAKFLPLLMMMPWVMKQCQGTDEPTRDNNPLRPLGSELPHDCNAA